MGRRKLCSVSIGFLAAIVTNFFTLQSAPAISLADGRTVVLAGVFYNQQRLRTMEPRSTHTQVQDWPTLQPRTMVPLQGKPGRYIAVARTSYINSLGINTLSQPGTSLLSRQCSPPAASSTTGKGQG
jgi:hypothetical protein